MPPKVEFPPITNNPSIDAIIPQNDKNVNKTKLDGAETMNIIEQIKSETSITKKAKMIIELNR
jgi:hypothetical protein